MRRLVLALALVGLVGGGCGDDAGTQEAPGSGDAPFGLSSVTVPASEADILRILEQMPDEISGAQRSADDSYALALYYGDSNSIAALPFPMGAEGSGAAESLSEDLSQFESEAGAVVEESQLDPASDLVWLVGSFSDWGSGDRVHLVVWGEPQGSWAFNVSAQTPQMRAAIAGAFVEAAGG